MFALFGNRRAFAAAWRSCASIFDDLPVANGQAVSTAVLVDPYVLGFLQPIVIEAVNEAVGGAAETAVWLLALQRVIDRLGNGAGQQALPAIETFSDPTHPGCANYLAGQQDGSVYALAIHSGDAVAAEAGMTRFRRHLATMGARTVVR